jgi:hypothetical protein
MSTLAYTLEQAEADLRNAYWFIRASRKTNWKYVNKVRCIREAMLKMGVTKSEIKDAMYCLKSHNCPRCQWNSENNLPCWQISKRRKLEATAG